MLQGIGLNVQQYVWSVLHLYTLTCFGVLRSDQDYMPLGLLCCMLQVQWVP